MTNVVDSIYHFAHAVREGREPLVSPADGLRNTETVGPYTSRPAPASR
jgi:predicted dehydrogenase